MTFRAILGAVAGASPWNSMRNWSPGHGGPGPGPTGPVVLKLFSAVLLSLIAATVLEPCQIIVH